MTEPTWLLDLLESVSPMIPENLSGLIETTVFKSGINVQQAKGDDDIERALNAVRQYLTESFPGEEITPSRPKDDLAWEFSVVRHSATAHTARIMRRFIDDHQGAWTNRLTRWDLARQMREVGAATVIVDTNGLTREDA